MRFPSERPSIVLLALASDPIRAGQGALSAQGERVRSLAQALAQVGWQVDVFTRQGQSEPPETIWIAPHCRVIRLAVG
jgi:D-inositol-3-phosphate glycosyltransferase